MQRLTLLIFLFCSYSALAKSALILHNHTAISESIESYVEYEYNDNAADKWINKYLYDSLIHRDEAYIFARFFIKNASPHTIDISVSTGGRDVVHIIKQTPEDTLVITTGWMNENFYPTLLKEKRHINKGLFYLKGSEKACFVVVYHKPAGRSVEPNLAITTGNLIYRQIKLYKVTTNYWQGIFQGFVAVLLFMNLCFYFINRDRVYIFYSLYNFFILIYTMSLHGYFYIPWYTPGPIAHYVINNIFLLAAIIYYLSFLQRFLNTGNRFVLWHKTIGRLRILYQIILVVSTWAIIQFQASYLIYDIRNGIILLCLVISIALTIRLLIHTDFKDKLFAFGTLSLIIFSLLSVVSYFAGAKTQSDLSLQIGIIIELILFTFALTIRTRDYEKEKLQTKSNLIKQLNENEKLKNEFIDRLEHEVTLRTDEISSQNEELLQQHDILISHREMLEHQNKVIEENFIELSDAREKLEQKVSERTEELAKTNKELILQNTQLEQYAFITAHNLRAPIARLLGLTDLLDKTLGQDAASREVSLHVRRAAKDMEEVITDLNRILDIRKNETSAKSILYYEEMFSKIFSRLEEVIKEVQPDIQLTIQDDHIYSIPAYFESIVYNLISNALKYRSPERTLKLEIETSRNNNFHILKIRDNGLGMDLKHNQQKIFGLYQRFHNHVDGKGLGLYLTKTQIDVLGGNIQINSILNKGTEFKVSIPISLNSN